MNLEYSGSTLNILSTGSNAYRLSSPGIESFFAKCNKLITDCRPPLASYCTVCYGEHCDVIALQ